MKTNLMFLIPIFLTLWSCQSYEEDLLFTSPDQIQKMETRSEAEEAVIAKVMGRHYGGYDRFQPDTRALSDFYLTPYVEDSDTLLFIAQFPEGWELYTAKTPLPVLVMSCDEGTFNIYDPEIPDPLRASIDHLIAELKQIDTSVSTTGMISSENLQAEGKVKVDVFAVNPDNSTMDISESDLPPGHWEVISSKESDVRSYTSPKLIKTQWGQGNPWNAYAKWINQNGEIKQAPYAGCTPVAIGQYLYYTHFKDGVPKYAPASAKRTPDGIDYTFPIWNMNVWNNMALSKNSYAGFNEVALLLGSIGRDLNSDYKHNETTTLSSQMIPYLNSNYTKGFEERDYYYGSIMGQIDKSYPILTNARTLKKDEDGTSGHSFIIDQYSKTISTIEYLWVWVRDPLPPGVTDIWIHDKKDSNGNIVDYAYKKIVTAENILKFGVSMNWGWNGNDNNTMYYDSNKWQTGESNSNIQRKIFIPK